MLLVDVFASNELPLALLPGFVRCLLFAPGSTEHVDHSIVTLVTCIFVELIRYRHEGRLCGPGSCKSQRIVDREPVKDCIGANTREPFDHVQVLARSPEPGLAGEISRIDYQRVAVPVANRISHPLPNV